MKIKQLDAFLLKIIVVLSLATGYFFNIHFLEFSGFKVTFFTASSVIIFTLGSYLTFRDNFMYFLILLMVLVFYLFISIDNQGFETYGIIFFANVLIIYLLAQKNIEINFLSNLGHIGMAIGLIVFVYYIYEVILYGEYVASNKELWNSSSGYTFRYTMGSVFSFQGFTINPNVAILPFLASFLISEIKRNKVLLSFIYILFVIMVAIATNSRGAVAMVMLVLSLFLIIRYPFKKILKVFSISGISLFLITLIFLNSEVLNTKILVHFENISDKIERSTDSKRLEKISDSMEIYKESPIFGGGLSAVQERYNMSTENGYVEYLAVFGSVGVLIFFLTSILWFHRRSYCLNNGIAWPLVMIYLIINIFNTGYMHPVTSLILGLSFMCFNPKNRVMPVNINKNKERTNFT